MSIKTPPYRIVTQRTVLRCYSPADAELLDRSVRESLDHLRRWMPWAHAEPVQLQARMERLRAFRGQFDLDQDYVVGIFTPDESRLIGGTGMHPHIGPDALEIGYWVHVDEVGKGYATEAAAALTRAAFEVSGVRRLEIHCDPRNVASAAVPRKLGYTHEATLRARTATETGALRDQMVWSLFREDYPRTPSAAAELQAFDAAGRRVL